MIQKEDFSTKAIRAIEKSRKWPLWIGFLLIALAVVSYGGGVNPPSMGSTAVGVVKEVGFAFVIAWVISVTVEISSREEYNSYILKLQEDFSKNIFGYLYGNKIPREMFEYVEDVVFRQDVYRRNVGIEVEFEEVVDSWVLLRVQFEFVVENISIKDVQHTVGFAAEKPIGSQPSFRKELGLYRMVIDGEDVSPESFLAMDCAKADSRLYKEYNRVVNIPSGKSKSVSIGIYQAKRTCDVEVWQSLYFCEDLAITVRYAKDEFDVEFDPIHTIDVMEEVTDEPFGKRAWIRKPLLPRNGVKILWEKKSERCVNDTESDASSV